MAALLFEDVFGFPGSDPGILLVGFVFLVALGIDYNIFLMTRAREESAVHGTKDGVLRALAVTGGVITSAGLVLAATFGALAVLPLRAPQRAGVPGRLRRPARHLRRPVAAGAGRRPPDRRQGLVAGHAGEAGARARARAGAGQPRSIAPARILSSQAAASANASSPATGGTGRLSRPSARG